MFASFLEVGISENSGGQLRPEILAAHGYDRNVREPSSYDRQQFET